MARHDERIFMLLEVLDSAFERRGWHGTTLRGALRGVTAEDAAWRPRPGWNSIWVLVLHCAYWKHEVRRRIAGHAEAFPRAPDDWPAVPSVPDEKQWKADVRLLVAEHAALRAAVAELDPARLTRWTRRRQWRYSEEVHGVAAHDACHTGQIQLVKKLRASVPSRS